MPVDLHVVVSDILQGAGHVDDIFIYFIRHAKQMFPHLECMDDLKKISDLSTPANWSVDRPRPRPSRSYKQFLIYCAQIFIFHIMAVMGPHYVKS